MKESYLVFILFIFSSLTAYTQTCCSGGVPVSSNIGFQSAEAQSTQLSITADLNFLKTLKTGSDRLDDDQRLRTTQSYLFRIGHTFNKNWSVEGLFPYVRQTRRISTQATSSDREATNGLGDPLALLIYSRHISNVTYRLGIGPQIPLGSFTERSSRGLTLLEDLQPGSGAWDVIGFFGLEAHLQSRPTALIYANVIQSWTGTNEEARGGTQSYEFGDDIQIIAGYADQVLLGSILMSPSGSMRFRKASRDQVNHDDLPGTGGTFVFGRLSNSLPFPKLNSSLVMNIELPLWTKVNETQLAPSFGFNFGWHLKIEKKNNLNIISEL